MVKKGFTLVELMVVVGILSIITLVVSQPLANVIKYQRESQKNDNMRDNLQFVMNKMEKELKTSSNVTIDTTSTPHKLRFTDQSNSPAGYYLSAGGEIKRISSSPTDKKLTENTVFKVDELHFSKTSPAGSASSISAISDNNLYGERFNGYYDDSPNFFDTAAKHGDTSLTSQINNFTNNADYYSWQWVGYFRPPTTGMYTFFTTSDDASHLWIGDNALTGYTVANALVKNGGQHGAQESASRGIELTAGQYYPIRIMFGENGGGDSMTVAFSGPGIPKTANGTGYYFGGSYFGSRFVNNNVIKELVTLRINASALNNTTDKVSMQISVHPVN